MVRKLACSFDNPSWNHEEKSPLSTDSRDNDSVHSTSGSDSHCLELELIHRWSVDTYKCFCVRSNGSSELETRVWQVDVVEDAMRHKFLLHGIFAVTALQLAVTTLEARASMLCVRAMEYYNSACSEFSRDIGTHSSYHQAIFAFSHINIVLGLALPLHTAKRGEEIHMLSEVASLFKLLLGTASVAQSVRSSLLESKFRFIFTADDSLPDLPSSTRLALDNLRAMVDQDYCNRAATNASQAVLQRQTCVGAINLLQDCFVMSGLNGSGTSACMRWPAMLETAFVEDFLKHEPLHLLIVMHWAVLLDRQDHTWWARSAGKLLVADIDNRLDARQKIAWSTAIRWIYTEVNLPQSSAQT